MLKLVALGLANKEIARVLTIAPKTVGDHVERSYAKVAAPTRAAAAMFAMQHGLPPEEEFPTRAASGA